MLNAALVGLGGWGQKLGRAVQGKSGRLRFVAGVTRTPSKAAEFAAEMEIPVDDDYAALLRRPDVEAVVLATPHSQHVEQIVAAAAAGKHIFVEKPLALHRTGAEEAVAACREANVVLAVGHNRRFLPAYREARRRLMSGELGRILHVEANFSGPSGYRRAAHSWRLSRAESPAGGMTGKGVHMTDLMIDLLGAPSDVQVDSSRQVVTEDTDDRTLVFIHFADGATGFLSTLTTTPDIWRIQVFCSEGWLELREHETLTIRRLEGDDTIMTMPAGDIEKGELEAFAEAVRGGDPYPVTAEQAVANVALLEQVAAASDKRA